VSAVIFWDKVANPRRRAALGYAARGWYVLPIWWVKEDGQCACGTPDCKHAGKHPLSKLVPNGAKDSTTDSDLIERWWADKPEANIAIDVEKSGLVGIDVDPRNGGLATKGMLEDQHGAFSSEVMQYSGGGGEHWVYQRPAALAGLPGKLGPGVDVKLNGYILVEPSNHKSGASYGWEASSSPLGGAIPSPLPDWIRSLSTVSQAAVTSWQEQGNRWVSPQTLEDLRDALACLSADDRETWVNYGNALSALGQSGWDLWDTWSRTSDKYDAVDAARVWRSCKPGVFNYESIFHAAQSAGWINPSAGVTAEIPPQIVIEEPAEPFAEPTSDGLRLPDSFPVEVLNRAVHWIEGFSEEPNRRITMQGVLALASVLAGRLYESENSNVTSGYFLTLAETGRGKGYPKEAIRRLLADAGLATLLSGSGNTSAGAVFSALFQAPTHIQITDEFGKQLQAARRQTTGAMQDALAALVEAYSDANGILVPRNYSSFHLSKKERAALDAKIVQRPAVTLFAFATPEQVFDNLTTGEIDDGFLNRLVAVNVTDGDLPEQSLRDKAVPPDMIAWARRVRRLDMQDGIGGNLLGRDVDYDMRSEPVIVPFDADARAQFAAFKREIRETEWLERKLTMRWRENAMRIATALAVAADPGHPTVSGTLARWAIDYVRTAGLLFMQDAVAKIADSDFHRLYLGVADALEKKAKPANKGLTEREIGRVFRPFKFAQPNIRNQVLDALRRDEVAERVEIKPASGRGRSRIAWVDCRFLPGREADD
jgi:hypothetical protein